jgi:hypothetical protein
VIKITAFDRTSGQIGTMSIVSRAELREIVSYLRAMAAAEPGGEVRDALNRLADRYSAMGKPRPPAAAASLGADASAA